MSAERPMIAVLTGAGISTEATARALMYTAITVAVVEGCRLLPGA